jgi:hexosaminidase
MYRKQLIFFICYFLANFFAVVSQPTISIIPKPEQLKVLKDSFNLSQAQLVIPGNEKAKNITMFFASAVKENYGINLLQKEVPNKIIFDFDKNIKPSEGYRLQITHDKIYVVAKNDTGLFWAVQTLRQLLPINLKTPVFLPCLKLTDAPRYSWRSNMLDVGRHFFPIEYIKHHIDMLSYYKFNVFHWHLTDDQGWRMEIKKYPDLTRIGAYRKESDGNNYGGFYTQEQIIEVVEYARQRYITVIPEIEMPGHCLAALTAYPELSCRKGPFTVPNYWGVINDVYCAGNERTYSFIEDVLTEVLELFPSKYIHIGGDEVPKYRWQQCPDCQKKIAAEKLSNEEGLQSYFIQRVQKFLESKGRVMIGWDEILEGGVSGNAMVEVWRGNEKALEAIHNKNKIIQTLYFDSPSSVLNLSKTFNYNPSMKKNDGFVLGAECPLWTENITEFNADYMLFPRVQAFAEVLWNGKTRYDDFLKRLEKHYAFMEKQNVLYGNETKALFTTHLSYQSNLNVWKLYETHGAKKLHIHYTTDGNLPDKDSPTFSDSLQFNQPQKITVAAIRDDGIASLPVRYSMEENLAIGLKPVFTKECNEKYNKGGMFCLTDGISGAMNYADGTWMAWWGDDLECYVDLGSKKEMHFLQINCMQQVQSWIILPLSVEFLISDDNEHWQTLATLTHSIPDQDMQPQIYKFILQLSQPINARYVKVKAKNYGKLPVWHNGAGGNAWLFADEFVLR